MMKPKQCINENEECGVTKECALCLFQRIEIEMKDFALHPTEEEMNIREALRLLKLKKEET